MARVRLVSATEAAGIELVEDSGRPSGGLEECDAAAERGPRLVAREHPVGRHLVRCCEHERVGESQASGFAAKTCRGSGDRGGDRLDSDGEVREERLEFGNCFGPFAVGPDQDLGVYRRGNHQVVVLMLGEGCDGCLVERIVGIEERDHDGSVEDG